MVLKPYFNLGWTQVDVVGQVLAFVGRQVALLAKAKLNKDFEK
jgi:hypothetical protein